MMENGMIETGELTEQMFEDVCFRDPTLNNMNVIEGIKIAMELDQREVFNQGLEHRLKQLGCDTSSREVMLVEVRRRFRTMLHKRCPKAIVNWVRGGVPGVTNRMNNYDLCYALEMDLGQTEAFFVKCYLTIPFIYKSRIDAVYLYCFQNHKPYDDVVHLLHEVEDYPITESQETLTTIMKKTILLFSDDGVFLNYLRDHCHDNKTQFQYARKRAIAEIEQVKRYVIDDGIVEIVSENRLNSLTVEAMLGYRYQRNPKYVSKGRLPRRFIESLPNDVTLGHIINNKVISYECLRKTLMLLRFYNFYHDAVNTDEETVAENLMDFHDELNDLLLSCGFAPIYVLHPFDCLLLYCANSFDPLISLHSVLEQKWN